MLEGADLFIGLSGARVLDASALARMNPDPIVFAMANPDPEVSPEEASAFVRVMATGRSDYPNQINNVLCFPGIFRGALDVRATRITEEMKMAAARAIADIVSTDELREDYIIPSVFNRDVVGAVASAVAEAARESGTAWRGPRSGSPRPRSGGSSRAASARSASPASGDRTLDLPLRAGAPRQQQHDQQTDDGQQQPEGEADALAVALALGQPRARRGRDQPEEQEVQGLGADQCE